MEGIHHVTAITGDARRNLDFYTRVVGLRMVAKTVNQDDPNVYHLFYGEERGRPGADLTFFEYPHAVPGRAGAGSVHRIVWRVASEEAIDFWEARLAAEGIETERSEGSLVFSDFEGLGLEVVVSTVSDPPLTADHPEIPAEFALQGFDGVRAYSASPAGTQAVLERLMGAKRRDDTTWRSAARAVAGGSRSTSPRHCRVGRAPAPCTTSRGASVTMTSRDGSIRSTARAFRTAASSTGTTSTRSTSASRVASCSSSPPRDPASPSMGQSRSSAAR